MATPESFFESQEKDAFEACCEHRASLGMPPDYELDEDCETSRCSIDCPFNKTA